MKVDEEPGLPPERVCAPSQFLGPGRVLPIGRSTWWAGVKSGRYPKPVKLSPRITVWPVKGIRALIRSHPCSG